MNNAALMKKYPISTKIMKYDEFARGLLHYQMHTKRKISVWTKDDWTFVSQHMTMPDEFMIEYRQKIDWKIVLKRGQMTQKLLVHLVGVNFIDDETKQLYREQLEKI